MLGIHADIGDGVLRWLMSTLPLSRSWTHCSLILVRR
jgi:hypothetical protein